MTHFTSVMHFWAKRDIEWEINVGQVVTFSCWIDVKVFQIRIICIHLYLKCASKSVDSSYFTFIVNHIVLMYHYNHKNTSV